MTSTAIPAPRRSSLSPPPLLPLPRSLRQNRSFVHLARLIGIASADKATPDHASDDQDPGADDSHSSIGDDDDDDADAASDVDEESLMWDAQTALIAHQPSLAAKYYETAALPPYRSSAACLALGNLLARGSSLSQGEDSSPLHSPSAVVNVPDPLGARSPPSTWFSSLFRTTLPPISSPSIDPPTPKLQSNGWGLPTDGKRAVRDVQGMGKAGGWLILGIGWIIEQESLVHSPARPHRAKGSDKDDDDVLVFSKGKSRARAADPAQSTEQPTEGPPGSSNSSATTTDSFEIQTPEDEPSSATPGKKIKLLYDLFTPLVHLYRHGHIQRHDPVALPPIAPSQLPHPLRPQGDDEKRRNVWSLGSVVAKKVLDLPLLSTANLSKDARSRQRGVAIMASYILGMASNPHVAEASFKSILQMGPCGQQLPDELIRQAYRHLEIILRTTQGSPVVQKQEYPFPTQLTPPPRTPPPRRASHQHRRRKSNASMVSAAEGIVTSSLGLTSPAKSTLSLTSLSCEPGMSECVSPTNASKILRGIQATEVEKEAEVLNSSTEPKAWWPWTQQWSRVTPRQVAPPREGGQIHARQRPSLPRAFKSDRLGVEQDRPLLSVASTPQLACESRRLPFEPTEAIAKIDPELAALELASALTKHVKCSVCGASGVNFPNCRKCGLTFCSRTCRVDQKAAGNGKRHVCGAWESRQLLTVPGTSPRSLAAPHSPRKSFTAVH